MVVEFANGPWAGVLHELKYGVPMPDTIGVNDDGNTHWYRITQPGNLGEYSHTEMGTTPAIPRQGGQEHGDVQQDEID
jgi:hypothetical protein